MFDSFYLFLMIYFILALFACSLVLFISIFICLFIHWIIFSLLGKPIKIFNTLVFWAEHYFVIHWFFYDVVVKMLNCVIVVSELRFQALFNIHLGINIFEKGMKPLIFPKMGIIEPLVVFYKDGSGIR